MPTWAHTQKTRALSALLYGIGSGAIEGLGAAQLLQEWQYKSVPLLQTDAQSALAVCKRRRLLSNETHRVEGVHSAGMADNGATRVHKGSTRDNPADFITKAMNREKLIKFGRALNLL